MAHDYVQDVLDELASRDGPMTPEQRAAYDAAMRKTLTVQYAASGLAMRHVLQQVFETCLALPLRCGHTRLCPRHASGTGATGEAARRWGAQGREP